jgi:His-Xaa-Ser repeat protein HxsA
VERPLEFLLVHCAKPYEDARMSYDTVVLPFWRPPRSTQEASGDVDAGEVQLTRDEKLKLQLLRVQIRLTTLGLYFGPIDGIRNAQTVEALKHFQVVKGIRSNGMMSTSTLNALGIQAVN